MGQAPLNAPGRTLCSAARSGRGTLTLPNPTAAGRLQRRVRRPLVLPSAGPGLVARAAFHHLPDPFHRDAGQPLGGDPDHVRVVLAPPVPEPEGEGVVPRGP